MKKINSFKILLLIVGAVALALTLTFCGDPFMYPDSSELIPSADEMGAPEGLWLYKRNERMRTDGSEKQRLLTNIVAPDGREYASNECRLCEYNYITALHKILFVINVENRYFLYGYDYKDKTGKSMYDLQNEDVLLYSSGDKIYVTYSRESGDSSHSEDKIGLLYDSDLNLLCDELYGTLKDGVLYSLSPRGDNKTAIFTWWDDGVHHLTVPYNRSGGRNVEVVGDYVYYLYDNTYEKVDNLIINLKKERYTTFSHLQASFDSSKYCSARRPIEKIYRNGDELYVFSVIYRYLLSDPDKSDWFYELHRIRGESVERIYDFGSARWGAEMHAVDGNLYFFVDRGGQKKYHHYYRFDTSTQTMREINASAYRETPTAADTEIKKVGDYEFYITKAGYGSNGWGGPAGHVYYLNRKHGNEVKVMQYILRDNYFYDDICEF